MSREALHMYFGGTDALEAFAALLLCERPFEPSDEAVRLAHMAAELARDRSGGRSGTKPLPVLIPGDLGPFRTLYGLAREQAKKARFSEAPGSQETKPALAMRLLLALRHRQRAAVGLRYVIGMPGDAIGPVLGLAPRAAEEVIRSGLNAIARGSRSKIDVRRNLRAAGATLAWNRPQEIARPTLAQRKQPRSVVRLLLAPSPFGLSEPEPIRWDAPLSSVVSEARPVYRAPIHGEPPPLPKVRSRPRRGWASGFATVAAGVIVVMVFAAWPHAVRVGPVPLAVVPLAPSVGAPAPRAPAGPVATIYTVRAGDTLWSIAARALGDPFRWLEVWRSNAGRRMNDGSRFVDPDLIRPGWRLSLPRRAPAG
jgi:hypothetical protein